VAFLSEQVLAPLAQGLSDSMANSPGTAYGYILVRFLAVYINFSGYTDIAVGAGRLFGLHIMENFRLPLIAASIQDFWQRWHLSLGLFMNEFIFRPLLYRFRGRPGPAIVLTFIIVGLWHDLTWNYVFWGMGHGGMMMLYFHWQRRTVLRPETLPLGVAWRAAGTVLTLSYVSLLSAFANQRDFAAGLDLLRFLFGL